MSTIRKAWTWKGAVAIALLSTLAPALSAPSTSDAAKRFKPRAISLSAPGILGSFTPASNPRMASMLAQASATGGGFRFTPSVAPGGRRAVTVAVRARAAGPAQVHTGSRPTAIAMAQANVGQTSLGNAYNLGAAIGWQRFVVSGDLANVDTGPLFGERKAADIGLSYAGKRWSTTVQLSADRGGSTNRFLGRDESVALDVGGSYRIAKNLDVTGGVRYKLQRDRLDSAVDNRRDSQSVYVGTAFRF